MLRTFLLYLIIFSSFFLGAYLIHERLVEISQVPEPSIEISNPKVQEEETVQPQESQKNVSKELPPNTKQEIPSQYDLEVPFVPQAPFGRWDDLHNNACEEASILLVHHFKQNKPLTKEIADKEIKKMVDYQMKKYGKHKDLTLSETADMAKEFYGYRSVKVVYDFTWDELKKEIVKGNPVIVPSAGRLLKNPNFRQPGPIYHMFVIRGYTSKEIITNDVGTRKGEGYRYSYQVLDKAIHDWNGSKETIQSGRRAMLVIEN